MFPPTALLARNDWTVPLSSIGKTPLGTIRLSTVKSPALVVPWKVATFPAGRKSILPLPFGCPVGVQLIVAVGEPMVIVSDVLGVLVRVTVPVMLPIVPWKACAWAFCGRSPAVAMATVAQEMRSLFRLARNAGLWLRIISSSTGTAWS